jgi:IMP dehydrogenase
MTKLRDLSLNPIWVHPRQTVASAFFVLTGHGARAIGVYDGERLSGILSRETLLTASRTDVVEKVAGEVQPTVSVDADVRDIAKRFADERMEFAVVMDGSRFAGIVSATDLLAALGRSFDPMTRLPWGDELRTWAIEQFSAGREISILFIDLDDFGVYNKEHGHVVGDQVIQAVAGALSEAIDPETDVLIRYGGDEFAIGTLRLRDEAEELGEGLRSLGDGLKVGEGVPPVSFSVGVFGGRRTKERENSHYASTIDDLINRASRLALAEKKKKKEVVVPVVVQTDTIPVDVRPAIPVRVVGVYAEGAESGEVTTVILAQGDTVTSGTDSRQGKRLEESVVQATVRALERTHPGLKFVTESLAVVTMDGQTVLNLAGRGYRNGSEFPVRSQMRSQVEPMRAVAEATVQALTA